VDEHPESPQPEPRTPAPPHDPAHGLDDDAAVLARQAARLQGGGARAAVLGMSDGLVTNLSLILGVAGADASRSSIRLAGFASLVAGAFSMAAGEWVSVRAQVDFYNGLLGRFDRHYVTSRPLIYRALVHRMRDNGLDVDTAATAASAVIADDHRGMAVAARLLLRVDPEELGSPWAAAISSLALFSVGAAVPLVPWLITSGTAAIAATVVITSIVGAIVGAFVAKTSDESVARGAARQVLIVALGAAVTFGVGRLVGTAVS
jgi:VIT1/CCC1 family predicted Fe2+/Mn2+ transporter